MTEVTESSTIRYLGLTTEDTTIIARNPTNKNISFHNCNGELNARILVDYMINESRRISRIVIFENSLLECGLRYLEITNVSYE